MNVADFLNRNAYPQPGQNARAKYVNKASEVTVAAATQEYNPFTAVPASLFAANLVLPFSGDNVFFLDKLQVLTNAPDPDLSDGAVFDAFMQSFLEITVNDRQLYKTSLISILSFGWQNVGVTAAQIDYSGMWKACKRFINPIIINATSNVKFRLHLNTAAATALDTYALRVVISGFQFDKLQQFEYNELQGNMFQRIDFDMYDMVTAVAAANTYNFFSTAAKSEELFSKILPLSEQEAFQVESIQVIIPDVSTDAPDLNLWYPRKTNRLNVKINDVVFYDSYIQDALSYFADYTTAAEDNVLMQQSEDVLKTPIMIPANSNNSVTLAQPASTVPAVGKHIMLRFQGELSRRVA